MMSYEGEDRRASRGRRTSDISGPSLKWIIAACTLAAMLVSVGVSWGTIQAQSNHKVDKEQQQLIDAAQDRQMGALELQLDLITQRLEKLDRIDNRVSKIFCNTVPSKLKDGCQ